MQDKYQDKYQEEGQMTGTKMEAARFLRQGGRLLKPALSCAVVLAIGACTGLDEMEEPAAAEVETFMVGDIEVRTDGNVGDDAPYRVDTRTLELEPGDGKEFKYRLEEGRTMLYSWAASGPVRIEMHSEADGGAEGSAEFFDVSPSGDAGHGAFTAPFPGIHGWYWENLSEEEAVTVTIRSSGFYSYGVEFPGGTTHQLDDVVEASGIE